MAQGTINTPQGSIRFGYSSFADWLDSVLLSFPAPWSVGGLDGKYYGTRILDSDGKEVLSVWLSYGTPSDRERGGMSDAEWTDYCSDSHWESASALRVAEIIAECRNHVGRASCYADDQALELLRALIIPFAEWGEGIWESVRCGGPLRRALPSDENIRGHWSLRMGAPSHPPADQSADPRDGDA